MNSQAMAVAGFIAILAIAFIFLFFRDKSSSKTSSNFRPRRPSGARRSSASSRSSGPPTGLIVIGLLAVACIAYLWTNPQALDGLLGKKQIPQTTKPPVTVVDTSPCPDSLTALEWANNPECVDINRSGNTISRGSYSIDNSCHPEPAWKPSAMTNPSIVILTSYCKDSHELAALLGQLHSNGMKAHVGPSSVELSHKRRTILYPWRDLSEAQRIQSALANTVFLQLERNDNVDDVVVVLD